MLSGDRVSEQDFAAVIDEVITLAGRHEVPITKLELLTVVALKLLRDTRGLCFRESSTHFPRPGHATRVSRRSLRATAVSNSNFVAGTSCRPARVITSSKTGASLARSRSLH